MPFLSPTKTNWLRFDKFELMAILSRYVLTRAFVSRSHICISYYYLSGIHLISRSSCYLIIIIVFASCSLFHSTTSNYIIYTIFLYITHICIIYYGFGIHLISRSSCYLFVFASCYLMHSTTPNYIIYTILFIFTTFTIVTSFEITFNHLLLGNQLLYNTQLTHTYDSITL